MKSALLFSLSFLLVSCGHSQAPNEDPTVGGPCEGCEAIYEYGDRMLDPVDTFPDFSQEGQKLMITGIVYQSDGKTPAANVIVYAYHTDQTGVYPTLGNETDWGRRHGYLRGWMKTGKDGRYTFYTLVPASYPGTTIEKHIHMTVKEPGVNEYYIDEIVFDHDPYLTPGARKRQPQRGGPGILKLKKEGNLHVGIRNIVLGKNIPGY